MEYYLTGEQAGIIDKYTQEVIGIPGIVLMEKAAMAIVDHIKFMYINASSDNVLAVVESGNNGGDAVAAVRILKTMGFSTFVYEINGIEKKSESYLKQVEIARNLGVQFLNDTGIEPDFKDFKIILDGIFGVGLSRPVTGRHAEVIEAINKCEGPYKIAVDIPSGINATTGETMGVSLKCNATVTFDFTKYGMLFGDGRDRSGVISCREIGLFRTALPKDMKKALPEEDMLVYEYDGRSLWERVPRRVFEGNKGTFGKLLVVAGSREIYGASYLASRAAYKAGAGMVKVVTDIVNRDVLCEKIPEALMLTYDSDADIEKFVTGAYAESIKWADAVVIGPGLGKSEVAKRLLEELINGCTDKKIVIDADALNLISEDTTLYFDMFRNRIGKGHIAITPHMLEMARLLKGMGDDEISEMGIESKDKITPEFIKENRLELATAFAAKYGVTVVLKDARTIVATPYEPFEVYINTDGNSGMAKAGSGDVLAGMIGGFMTANKLFHEVDFDTAVRVGVRLHAIAGDYAQLNKGINAMLADDIVEHINEAFRCV